MTTVASNTSATKLLSGCLSLASLVVLLSIARLHGSEPPGILLTWQQDPTTTITVDWHTQPDEEGGHPLSRLSYGLADTGEFTEVEGERLPFPHSDRMIHRVELTGLEPGTAYEFQVGPFARRYVFRTMPADLKEPIRFAAGGDVMHRAEWMAQTNREAMKHEPDFVLWGGDLAYANGQPARVGRWYEFFEVIRETLITEEGRVVPVVVAIGNHEVRGGYTHRIRNWEPTEAMRADVAPFFYGLFAFPGQPGYNVLDFGDYLSLVILDSMHTNEPGGEQSEWLENVLRERTGVPHVFPLYHVAGWSSVKGIEYRYEQREVRQHFYPLFEKYGVRVAFECHDHAYKRTPPLREGKIVDASEGVVYIGDGAWGVSTRDHIVHIDPDQMKKSEEYGIIEVRDRGVLDDIAEIWYLEAFANTRHFILATIQGDRQHILMVDENGEVIDEYTADDFNPKVRQR